MEKLITIEPVTNDYRTCNTCGADKGIQKIIIKTSNISATDIAFCPEHLQQAVKELNESMPEPVLDDWHKRRKEHYEKCSKELFDKIRECKELAREMKPMAFHCHPSIPWGIEQMLIGILYMEDVR